MSSEAGSVVGVVADAPADGLVAPFPETIGVQEQAAATIADLAYGDLSMQDRLIANDCVKHLLTLLRHGEMLAQEYAARAIWHLCASTINQGVVVESGAISELVGLSDTGTSKAQAASFVMIRGWVLLAIDGH